MALTEETRAELVKIAARYPVARSGLNPMLHLVQSEEGYVSPEGIELCAEVLGLAPAEVAAVSTFYTMYKRRPVGEHHIGVCVNPQCGILGGEAIFDALASDLGIGNDETSEDGKITIERIECQAACTYAPVATLDWEFMDDMSVDKMRDVVTKLQRDEPVESSRGPVVKGFRAAERVIAGIDDGLADAGRNNADAIMLRGLSVAKELRMPAVDGGATP